MSQNLLDDDGVSNPSNNTSLTEVVERAIAHNPNRRLMLKSGIGAAMLPFLGGLAACGGGDDSVAAATPPERMLGFAPVGISTGDTTPVPTGYIATPFLPWGEPINDQAPVWRTDVTNSSEAQEQQIGDNHDGIAFFGFNAAGNAFGNRSDEGLLVQNHEYINPEYFYAPDTDPANWMLPFTFEKAKQGLAGHGVSVSHVRRTADGSWIHVKQSPYNRRIHGNTPISIQGPAAGLPLMRTAADPSGRTVLGTLNNCGNGDTPWGTYLTCEENFNGYFGWTGSARAAPADPLTLQQENRYGISQNGFGYLWHTADPRFDVNANPNEPNRFGWIVEIDPFSPGSQPVKRTAMGRVKHENAEVVIARNGRAVVYTGDDERNEYIYKFVSDGTFDAANPTSAANRRLLESGTLYVARFDAGATTGDNMGTGVWLPLVWGQGGLTTANGFTSQGDVLLRTRQAADRLGATMMDRPEWVAANPNRPGEVYITLTNNNRRGTHDPSLADPLANAADGSTRAGSARPAVDEANPRANNVWGHILRWNEAGADASALTFTWDIFVLAGQPSIAVPRAPSANVNAGNLFTSPDGLWFDSFGRLWILTDGSFSNTGEFANMGNNQVLVGDPQTREIRRFMVGPSGSEFTGMTMTPDRRTMFVNVQHPGELSSHPRALAMSPRMTNNDVARNPTAFSQWPTPGVRPRSATVVVRRIDGGVIGG